MTREKVYRKLIIKGDLSREEIRKKVINAFLEELPGERYEYWYEVETLSDGRKIFLRRPTRRFDFDFKIIVEGMSVKGTHGDIVNDLKDKRSENEEKFKLLMKAINEIYDGKDVNVAIEYFNLNFESGLSVELLLKLLKWMFILEDVYYWNYKGRQKLMDAIKDGLSQRSLL